MRAFTRGQVVRQKLDDVNVGRNRLITRAHDNVAPYCPRPLNWRRHSGGSLIEEGHRQSQYVWALPAESVSLLPPVKQREHRMTAILSKPSIQHTDPEVVLKSAVEKTCSELIEVYQIDGVKLALLVDTIAHAILEKFREGQRDASLLSAHATRQALKSLGLKLS